MQQFVCLLLLSLFFLYVEGNDVQSPFYVIVTLYFGILSDTSQTWIQGKANTTQHSDFFFVEAFKNHFKLWWLIQTDGIHLERGLDDFEFVVFVFEPLSFQVVLQTKGQRREMNVFLLFFFFRPFVTDVMQHTQLCWFYLQRAFLVYVHTWRDRKSGKYVDTS